VLFRLANFAIKVKGRGDSRVGVDRGVWLSQDSAAKDAARDLGHLDISVNCHCRNGLVG
jgi:hypothetical protein